MGHDESVDLLARVAKPEFVERKEWSRGQALYWVRRF